VLIHTEFLSKIRVQQKQGMAAAADIKHLPVPQHIRDKLIRHSNSLFRQKTLKQPETPGR
jgi:hypothetical protein